MAHILSESIDKYDLDIFISAIVIRIVRAIKSTCLYMLTLYGLKPFENYLRENNTLSALFNTKEMASGGTPYNKTEVLFKFNPTDFGPLNVLSGSHYKSFTGGCYYMTTVVGDSIKLYRLYGGKASAEGQYWTFEPRQGNLGYRHDAAVLQDWNSLQKSVELIVPRGIHLYEGQVGQQSHYLGGGQQVFIPGEVVERLFTIQKNLGNKALVQQKIKEIEQVQMQTLKQWETELNNNLASRALSNGSHLCRLSPEVRHFLRQKSGPTSSSEKVTPGKYLIHRDNIPSLGGGRKDVSVSVKIEFVKSETRTNQSGRTKKTNIINYYNIITTISAT